jgi:DNA-binding transcriptional ArsR family regulator
MPTKTAQNFLIDDVAIKKAALVYRAIKHPLRQKMMHYMHQQGAVNVTTLYKRLKLEQSVASQHLAILRRAGLVDTERQGKEIYYRVDYARLKQVHDVAKGLIG